MITDLKQQIKALQQQSGLPFNRLFHFLYQPYKWCIYLPLMITGTLVLGLLFTLFTLIRPGAGEWIAILWSRWCAGITPMWVRVEGRENLDPATSYVIVSNHLSAYDIFLLYGWIGTKFKWVMKKELRAVPIIGFFCARMGHIYIDRADPKGAIATIRKARGKIQNGTSVLFFPEGTRSRNGRMGRFKKGAFKMALDLHIPVLPVTIRGTDQVLPTKTMDLFPGSADLIIHPPVSVDGYDDANMEQLMDRVRSIIESA